MRLSNMMTVTMVLTRVSTQGFGLPACMQVALHPAKTVNVLLQQHTFIISEAKVNSIIWERYI